MTRAVCVPGARGVARWRCAIGWVVYVAIAAVVIAFAGAAAGQTPVSAGDTISIIPSVAGGSRG